MVEKCRVTKGNIPSFVRKAILLSPVYPILFIFIAFSPLVWPVRVQVGTAVTTISSLQEWFEFAAANPGVMTILISILGFALFAAIPQARVLLRIIHRPSLEEKELIRKIEGWRPEFFSAVFVPRLIHSDRFMVAFSVPVIAVSIIAFLFGDILGLSLPVVAFLGLLIPAWFAAGFIFAPLYLLLLWYPRLPKS